MAEKESFVFYASFYEALQDLKDKDRLKMYDAICELALNNKETKMTGLTKTIFTLIKPQILANQKRYENGKKGGRHKKETNGSSKEKTNGFENKKTTGYEKVETKTKPNENVNVNVNENDNENVNANVNASALYDADVEKIDSLFIETMGNTNISNIQECIKYLDKLPIEVIEYALRKTARKGAKWDYAMTILDSYVEKNLNTLEKIQADEIEFKNKTNKNTDVEETEEEKTKKKIKDLEERMNANK